MAPKMAPKSIRGIRPFGDLFRTSIFGYAFWSSLGSTLGSLLAPFGSLLAPFGSLLAPFGSLLAPFGSLLAPFGSLLAPFWHPPGSFSHFWQLFGFVPAFFMFFGSKFAPKWYFMRIFEQNIFLWANPSAKKSGTAARAHSKRKFPKAFPSSLGPGAEPCRRQLRSAPGRRRPYVRFFHLVFEWIF